MLGHFRSSENIDLFWQTKLCHFDMNKYSLMNKKQISVFLLKLIYVNLKLLKRKSETW